MVFRCSVLGVRDRIKQLSDSGSHNREHKTLKWVKNFESVYKLNNWFSVKLQNCGWIPCLRVRDSWPWLHTLTHQVRTQWTSELFLVTEWSLPGASIHWSNGGKRVYPLDNFPQLCLLCTAQPQNPDLDGFLQQSLQNALVACAAWYTPQPVVNSTEAAVEMTDGVVHRCLTTQWTWRSHWACA